MATSLKKIYNNANDNETTETTEVDFEVGYVERDAKELADRYADFLFQLEKRGVSHELAVTMTNDLMWCEHSQSQSTLPLNDIQNGDD